MKTSLLFMIVGLAIGLLNLNTGSRSGTGSSGPITARWLTEFEGRPLEPIPLSAKEAGFARSFPGAIGVFKSPGGRQVILRRVDRATRRLHDSATCLKAGGYRIVGRKVSNGWVRYEARRAGQRALVRERIEAIDGNGAWTEVSAWFWAATFHRDAGPWLAVTVLDMQSNKE